MQKFGVALLMAALLLLSKSAQAVPVVADSAEIRDFEIVNDQGASPSKEVLSFSWPEDERNHSVDYHTSFDRPQGGRPGQSLFLIVPPIWCNYAVTLNGKVITKSRVSEIYSKKILEIASEAVLDKNDLRLSLHGNFRQCKVRGDFVTLTNDERAVLKQRVLNFALNDFHSVATIINIFMVIFCLSLLSIRELRWPLIALTLSLIFEIPHNLLASGLYRDWIRVDDPTTPFYFQLVCQCVAWPNVLMFYYFAMNSSRTLRFRTFAYLSCGILGVAGAMLGLAYVDRAIFHHVFNGAILLFIGFFLAMFFRSRENTLLSVVFALSTSMFVVSGISELVDSNLYFMVYGWMLLSLTGLYIVRTRVMGVYYSDAMMNQIIAKFIPKTCYGRLRQSIGAQISSGTSDANEVITQASGHGFISTVLIDICDWGLRSAYDYSRVQPRLTYNARLKTFAQIQTIAAKHDIDLIKSQGDNLKYTCGLYLEQDDRQTIVANRTLKFIVDIIESIDAINASLRAENLPIFEIKIAACMGSNQYGIEQYLDRIQFDTIGHEVNIAYRLESDMDQSFYDQYGKNVALVHESLIAACSDQSLIKLFSQRHVAKDKHEVFSYNCFVLAFEKRDVRISDLARNLGEFFSPTPKAADPSNVINLAVAKDKLTAELTREEKRAIGRELVYIGENLKAYLNIQGTELETEIIDFAHQGLGLAVEKREVQAILEVGTYVDVRFKVSLQEFSSQGQIARISDAKLRGKTYLSIGVRLLEAERKSAERSGTRFTTDPNMVPMVSVQSPYTFRQEIVFRALDLSHHGMRLEAVDTIGIGFLIGLNLDINVFVPLVGNIACKACIKHVESSRDGRTMIGVEIIDNIDKFQEMVAIYLLHFDRLGLTFKSLRDEGFIFSTTKNVLSFAYRQGDEDLEKIKQLRKMTLIEEGVQEEGINLDDMIDQFDAHSRHVLIMHGDRLIAAARIVFNDANKDRIEHLAYGANLPSWLFGKKFVEMSRVSIAAEYRSADVFVWIMYHMARIAVESGHEWVVMSCHSRLMVHYKKFGFNQVGAFKADDGKVWLLGACNVTAVVDGRKFLPAAFALGLGNLSSQLKEQGNIDSSLLQHVNFGLMNALKPMVLKKARAMRRESKAS